MDINEVQIKKLIEDWAEAVRQRDIEKILAHHSEEVVMYDVPKPFQSVGIDAYRKTWDTFFNFTKPGVFDMKTLRFSGSAVDGDGGVAPNGIAVAGDREIAGDRLKTDEL